ncbi:MAG TPA: NnrS family protein [Cellvibrionaceae bacterium]
MHIESDATALKPRCGQLLASPFRLFFLLAAVYAVLLLLGWLGFLFANWPLPLGFSPFKWHSHEMLYGFVGAAIAGFLLTALANWTNTSPLQGTPLAALGLCWLAGRTSFWALGVLPPWLSALGDLSFWVFLLVFVTRTLLTTGNKRNLPIAGIIGLLTLGNGVMHWGFITGNTGALLLGQNMALGLITLLMAIIGGRIIPLFSRNWFSKIGGPAQAVTQNPLLDKLAILSLLLLLLISALPVPPVLVAASALAAAIANTARLYLWRGWLTLREPLLWSLHLGYAWLVLSLWLRGLSVLMAFNDSLWQHTLAVGAMGTLILAVMTRVAVGHTGRPLVLLPGGLYIYLAITGAALLRLLVATGSLPFVPGLMASGLCWLIAFGLFVILYTPVLTAPRVDGRPG